MALYTARREQPDTNRAPTGHQPGTNRAPTGHQPGTSRAPTVCSALLHCYLFWATWGMRTAAVVISVCQMSAYAAYGAVCCDFGLSNVRL